MLSRCQYSFTFSFGRSRRTTVTMSLFTIGYRRPHGVSSFVFSSGDPRDKHG